MIDKLGLHCLACIKGASKQARHSIINDVVYRSMVSAKIQAVKEPTGLCKDGKRARRRFYHSLEAWQDSYVGRHRADSFAASYIKDTSVTAVRLLNCGNEKDGKIRRVDPNLSFRSTCLRGYWSLER